MNMIQIMAFEQSLLLKLKFPQMEISRNAQSFRAQFKKHVGLPKNASIESCIQEVIRIYEENNKQEKADNLKKKLQDYKDEHKIPQ